MTVTASMSETDRRKVFWLLKKYSSYTAWQALGTAYYAFADAWMVAMRKADDVDIDDFNQNATKYILDGRIGFEKGLARLRQGDRRVWREGHDRSFAAWGWLAQAASQLDFIRKIMDPEEYVLDWMENRDEVVAAANALEEARFCQETTLERMDDQAAPNARWNVLLAVDPVSGITFHSPEHLNFPANLPEVPEPSSQVVKTGATVLVDGIYEPEWGGPHLASVSGLLGKAKLALIGRPNLMRSADGESISRLENIGCMNYLIADATAPPYADQEPDPAMPVTWRLIWNDDRYLDNVIPGEEVEYLAAFNGAHVAILRCAAGQNCLREGYWFTPARNNSRRHFNAGEVMPDVGGDYGSTIWQWDAKQ